MREPHGEVGQMKDFIMLILFLSLHAGCARCAQTNKREPSVLGRLRSAAGGAERLRFVADLQVNCLASGLFSRQNVGVPSSSAGEPVMLGDPGGRGVLGSAYT